MGKQERIWLSVLISLCWNIWMGTSHLVVSFLSNCRKCPRVARSSGSAETRAATQAQEETEFIRLLWLENVQGG